MGYQLFDGGHEVETEYDWQSAFEPNRMFVPANKEVHGLIHDEKYNKGRYEFEPCDQRKNTSTKATTK